MNIASAVTTCPRPGGISYLESTLESLHDGGFEPVVFDDREFTGSWPNLRRALQGRFEARPDAEAIVVFQDDVRVARGLRGWLNDALWPAPVETIGVVSLYTATPNHLRPGWFTLDDLPVYRPYGALAFCFPRHAVELLLQKPANLAFKCGSDTSVATFCRNNKLSYWLHSPSLVEHVGEVSSIADVRGAMIPERCSGNFCEDVDELA